MSDRPESSTSNKQTEEGSSAELTAVVDELLNQLSSKFSNVSSELIAKMDDMSRRLDALESTIQAGGDPKSEDEDK
ncbi:uncharacterized protein K452DRAFT_291518 [Aplosporella prunicola CBS 121167]|uniref:Heat shock factor-binding protein 1 n=1 Tax=Aplosporella prunicola CBS 121167 TaxID=1176127 RepID=A0A6A6B0C1_9PEZI|nr:uncharacterized protein K452DRAFT_291518 [Aplosporella prunicola CBS 121167]KAF2137470.1 hypothetical protein K452DRAFT_291518 [Aplosporella prunicola CBS 121167]